MSDDPILIRLHQIADAIGVPVSAFLDAGASPTTAAGMAVNGGTANTHSQQLISDRCQTAELLALWNATDDRQVRERAMNVLRDGLGTEGESSEAAALVNVLLEHD